MRVQAFLTAMAVNLKRLAAALAVLWAALSVLLAGSAGQQSDGRAEAAAFP
jgi:preprotein translocase subunit SecG